VNGWSAALLTVPGTSRGAFQHEGHGLLEATVRNGIVSRGHYWYRALTTEWSVAAHRADQLPSDSQTDRTMMSSSINPVP